MMFSRWLLLVGFFFLSSTLQTAPVFAFGMAKMVIKVVDEDGLPIENAQVSLRFQGGGLEKDRTKGETDKYGVFSAFGPSSDGSTGGGVYKNGYYKSVFHHDFYVTRLGMWQPFGKEITVVMRPIVNPVPMYVRDSSMKFPAFGSEVGFDLMKADWVIPYGQGTQPDFIFKIERQYDDTDNYKVKMTLTFPNPYDGIQVVKDDGGGDFNAGSSFRLPRMAPLSGYQSILQKHLSRGSYGRHSDRTDDNNYIFRVRSEVDENGKLKRAMYGKIRKDLNIYASGEISMEYYLNPDYTRNLEFDYKRNLFKPVSGER